MELTSAAVFIIARDRFEYVNHALAALAGYSADELLAIDPFDLTHPDSLPEALRRLPAARAVSPLASTWELRIRTRHGEHITTALRSPPPWPPVILLVEDEEPVRELIGHVLERHGFQVIRAASGEEGLRLEHDHHVDLLLSDVMLPGQNGFHIARQILERSPHVRVMFMSGYTRESNVANSGLDPETPLIQKPFKLADLVDRIRDTLGVSALRAIDKSSSPPP